MTFDEWWEAGTSTKVPLYGEANAKKAWDYQQARLNELRKAVRALPVEEMVYEEKGELVLAGYCMQVQGEWDRVQKLLEDE
jgi:hypothetical protein